MNLIAKIGVGLVLILLLVVIGFVGAISTGVIVVDSAPQAAVEILTGNVESPGVTVESTHVADFNAPDIGLDGADDGSIVFRTIFKIDNSMNHIGGTVDEVNYDVYMAGNPDEEFKYVGNGSSRDIVIPPGDETEETTDFEAGYQETGEAVGFTLLETRGDIYVRVQGESIISIGPFSISVPFEDTEQVSLAE